MGRDCLNGGYARIESLEFPVEACRYCQLEQDSGETIEAIRYPLKKGGYLFCLKGECLS